MKIELNIMYTEVFGEIMELVRTIYAISGPEIQEMLAGELERIVGNTHDVRRFLNGFE